MAHKSKMRILIQMQTCVRTVLFISVIYKIPSVPPPHSPLYHHTERITRIVANANATAACLPSPHSPHALIVGSTIHLSTYLADRGRMWYAAQLSLSRWRTDCQCHSAYVACPVWSVRLSSLLPAICIYMCAIYYYYCNAAILLFLCNANC